MSGNDLSIWVALGNGFISFFTPCVLPLLPIYFGYLAGTSIDDIQNDKSVRKTMIQNTIGFVLGLSFLNLSLGFGAKAINVFLLEYSDIIRRVGGVLIILFGLYFIGLFKFKFLNRERKIHYKNYTPSFLKSLLLGITFSFGWTPCNGPILGSILLLASFEQNYIRAGGLMLVYSLGFALPFITSAILLSLFTQFYKKIFKYFDTIKWIAGVLLIIMGVLLYLDKLALIY